MTAKRKTEGPGNCAPAYLVTYSDMVTLLLTFFVLLMSLGDKRSPDLFRQGQESFRRAIAGTGMSRLMFNRNTGSQFNHPKITYKIDTGEGEGRRSNG